MTPTIKVRLVMAILLAASTIAVRPASGEIVFKSPTGKVAARIGVGGDGRLTFSLSRGGKTVLDASPLGITVDGGHLGAGVTLAAPTSGSIDRTYAWRGLKSQAVNRCNTYALPVTHTASKLTWQPPLLVQQCL